MVEDHLLVKNQGQFTGSHTRTLKRHFGAVKMLLVYDQVTGLEDCEYERFNGIPGQELLGVAFWWAAQDGSHLKSETRTRCCISVSICLADYQDRSINQLLLQPLQAPWQLRLPCVDPPRLLLDLCLPQKQRSEINQT